MHQAVLTLGSAPDCRTFIYTLKVLHTHHHRFKFFPKCIALTRAGYSSINSCFCCLLYTHTIADAGKHELIIVSYCFLVTGSKFLDR